MNTVTVAVVVDRDISTVWSVFTLPEHIVQWNQASEDWHCPKATNDLVEGGHFSWTMAAKDASASFDFEGTYTRVDIQALIEYTIIGGRKVSIRFEKAGEHSTKVTETFEMESENSEERQREGWQAILESFKQHAERI
ncbi:SRPBCC domain-containing protein [Candidatus Woesebacteria bacterium]|nr:SRPBCC domain-containing protein [Candidatus Woesebacteria bacterium]